MITVLGCAISALGARAAAAKSPASYEDAERTYSPEYLRLATGGGKFSAQDASAPEPRAYPWPVPLSFIGHSIASYQNYEGTLSGAYFHHGLDILAAAGSPVRACAGGKVVAVENYVPGQPLYWEVAILDADGYLWQYHHIARDSIPAAVQEALKTGAPIAAGTVIGAVVSWPISSFGVRYHHIHLNVIGAGKTYINPLAFLEPLQDVEAPRIRKIAVLQNGREVPATAVRGPYSLTADVEDLILGPKDFIVPPHSLSYSLDGGPAVTVWRFDALPAARNEYVNDFFVPSLACGNYECRRLVIDLGFSTAGPRKFPAQPGRHRIVVTAQDFSGNATSKEFSWEVAPAFGSALPSLSDLLSVFSGASLGQSQNIR